MTTKWYWSYAIHLLIWAMLAILALLFKVPAHLPIAVMFLIAALPYVIVKFMGGSEAGLMRTAYFVYQMFWLILAAAWIWLGIRRWSRGKPNLLLAIPHAVIAFIGWLAVLLVGTINFPFQL